MKRLFIIIVTLLVTLGVSAQKQSRKFDPEAYKAEQHKFIQQRVQFTQDEAAKFFPLLDEMRSKERQIFDRNKREKQRHPATDEECARSILERDKADIELKNIQMQYHQRMLKVVPARKLMDAIMVAEQFDHAKFREMFGGKKEHRQHPESKKD